MLQSDGQRHRFSINSCVSTEPQQTTTAVRHVPFCLHLYIVQYSQMYGIWTNRPDEPFPDKSPPGQSSTRTQPSRTSPLPNILYPDVCYSSVSVKNMVKIGGNIREGTCPRGEGIVQVVFIWGNLSMNPDAYACRQRYTCRQRLRCGVRLIAARGCCSAQVMYFCFLGRGSTRS